MSKKIEISKEVLEKIVRFYILENHSKEETIKKFNISGTKLKNTLAENGFKKTSKYSKNPKKKAEGKYENKLKCLECGKEDVINLYQHIKLLHHMAKEEYIEKYGYSGNFVATPDKNLKEKMGKKKDNFKVWNKGLTKNDDRVAKAVETRRNNGNYIMSSEQKEKISNTLAGKALIKEEWKNCDYIKDRDKLVNWCNEFKLKMNRKPTFLDLSKFINCSYHTAERIAQRNNIRHLFKINGFSKLEISVEDFIQSLNIEYKKHDRTQIKPLELDFYFPKQKVAIEVNDIATHNSTRNTTGYCKDEYVKDKNYHTNKSKTCEENGIRLIHIWEYEWNNDRQRPILENIIQNALGLNNKKIYARKLKIEIKESKTMREFFNTNNIQGFRPGKFAICLVDKNTNEVYMSYMMGSAFFGKGKYEWEVIRGATKLGYTVVGGASKIWKYFLNTYKPKNCVYYIDYNYFNGNSLPYLGLKYLTTQVSFKNWWVKEQAIKNRQPSKNKEISEKYKTGEVLQIYNAGTKVYLWESDN